MSTIDVGKLTEVPAYSDDEIELIDLIRIIWKWKWLIVVGTLVFSLSVGLYSQSQPKIYSVDMVIRPGVADITDQGGFVYIDNEQNIRAMIQAGTFNYRISNDLNQLQEDEILEDFNFDVELPSNTNTIKVSYKTSRSEQGIFILERLYEYLIEHYAPIIKRYKQRYELKSQELQNAVTKIENDISRNKNEIAAKESSKVTEVKILINQINKLKAQIESKKKQIDNEKILVSEIDNELKRVSKNTDALFKERDMYLKTLKNENNVLASIIYSNTIQQNIGYLDKLKDRKTKSLNKISVENSLAEEFRQDIKSAEARIENNNQQKNNEIGKLKAIIQDLESEKKFKEQKMEDFEFRKVSIENVKKLQSAVRSAKPVGPRVFRNIILAFVASLISLMMVVFFVNYLISASKLR